MVQVAKSSPAILQARPLRVPDVRILRDRREDRKLREDELSCVDSPGADSRRLCARLRHWENEAKNSVNPSITMGLTPEKRPKQCQPFNLVVQV